MYAAIFALVLVILLLPACAAPQPSLATHALLATYFTSNGEHGVFLASSDDADTFTPLIEPNIPILRPTIGKDRLIRDACILSTPRVADSATGRPSDRRWHMVWTTGWWDRGFGIAHSADLPNWTDPKYIPAMEHEAAALNCWAPEIAYDPARDEYIIFWATTIPGRFHETDLAGDDGPDGAKLNHRIYATRTRDFFTYSPAALFYNPGFSCIDATFLPDLGSAAFTMFFKDETLRPPAKNLRALRVHSLCKEPIARAIDDPASSYLETDAPSSPITGDYWAEGPTAIHLNGKIRVYFDRYTENRFGAVESADLKTWTDISDRVHFPPGARHSTVVWIERAELEQLKAAIARQAQAAPPATK